MASLGFLWIWLARFTSLGSLRASALHFYRICLGMVGSFVSPSLLSDFFRVPLGLAEGLNSSGFLWRRASLLGIYLGLSCLGFAGFAGFCGSHFFMASA